MSTPPVLGDPAWEHLSKVTGDALLLALLAVGVAILARRAWRSVSGSRRGVRLLKPGWPRQGPSVRPNPGIVCLRSSGEPGVPQPVRRPLGRDPEGRSARSWLSLWDTHTSTICPACSCSIVVPVVPGFSEIGLLALVLDQHYNRVHRRLHRVGDEWVPAPC